MEGLSILTVIQHPDNVVQDTVDRTHALSQSGSRSQCKCTGAVSWDVTRGHAYLSSGRAIVRRLSALVVCHVEYLINI